SCGRPEVAWRGAWPPLVLVAPAPIGRVGKFFAGSRVGLLPRRWHVALPVPVGERRRPRRRSRGQRKWLASLGFAWPCRSCKGWIAASRRANADPEQRLEVRRLGLAIGHGG